MSDEPVRMTPAEVINRITEAAIEIGWSAGVGQMETAGSIISYLAEHPDQIEPFLSGKVSVLDWPPDWHANGCLTWHGRDGKIYTPQFVRRQKVINSMKLTGKASQ